MALNNGLLVADVMHRRFAPKKHSLHYKVYYLCVPMQRVNKITTRILSIGKFNLFSFYERDYGFGECGLAWAKHTLEQHGIGASDCEITLLTIPRLFGYAFNPVSFWFCADKQGRLHAVIAEVNNTFGERHAYLCMIPDGGVITQDSWIETDKVFHVSPFLEVRGNYRFRFSFQEKAVGVWIDYFDGGQHVLATSLVGKRYALTTRNLIVYFLRYPLVTLKVISMIHYHALRLLLKGVRYRTKPRPPLKQVTR